MKKWLINQWRNLKLAWYSLFYGMKSADDIVIGAKTEHTGEGLTVNKVMEADNVFVDLLKGEVTERVVETRHSLYAVHQHSIDMEKKEKRTKKNEINEAFLPRHCMLVEGEYYPVKLIQENYSWCEFQDEPPQYLLKIERGYTPRLKIEEITTKISIKDFYIKPSEKPCRIIKIIPEQITTEELIEKIDWSKNNGIDIERDILKLAVLERHNNTGHKGVGFINGIGLKKGAIASSVSHDSHNIIVIGTNDEDMVIAANRIRENGGNVVVVDGEIIAEMPLRIAGLMSEYSSDIVVEQNASVRRAVHSLGIKEGIEPFMNMAFVSLSVIPALKMTTQGLLDVNAWKLVPLEI